MIQDELRVAYHRAHLRSVADARAEGANVRSYHAWSLYDNFEWASGYRPRFGLVHVDYVSQRRRLKASGAWYREVCWAARAGRGAGVGWLAMVERGARLGRGAWGVGRGSSVSAAAEAASRRACR